MRKKTTQPINTPLPEDLQREIQACKRELEGIGIALRGTVLERYMPCGKPRCRCHADPPALHGPYYQWTTKVDGKTKTVGLTAEQARVYDEWIANGRRLNEVVKRWTDFGIRAAELIRP